jgi:DNA-binding transcriptional regulator GbsR (MarR family)
MWWAGGVPDGVSKTEALSEVEREVVRLCGDGVRVAGLPKSIGEIYGLLFISREALSLDDLVGRLGISKGSASQGLKMLRTRGAIREAEGADPRRSYFTADLKLKQLVGGFIREQMRPHLESGQERLKAIRAQVEEIEDTELRQFHESRVKKLVRWSKHARLVFPLVQRVLGE